MSLAWIFSLLWARKLIVLTAAVASLLGGVAVMFVAPPRYLASARVVLEFVKPDPITGRYLSSAQAETYVVTQMQRARDYQVAIPAVEALGWLDNPDMISGYAARSPGDRRPYPVWVADQIMATTSARMVPESNIMRIEYRASSPEEALLVVEALREAYLSATVEELRTVSMAQADAISARIAPIQAKLNDLEAKKTEFSRRTGVILTESEKDPDDLRLKRMVSGEDPTVQVVQPQSVSAALELASIEAEIAAARQTLGPNNPQLQALERQRAMVAVKVGAERATAASSAGAYAAEARAQQDLTEAQKAKVLAKSEDVLQLRLQQDEINRYRKTLTDQQKAIAMLRQLGTTTAAGVTTLGEPEAEPTPVFPRPALVLGGSGVLGLLLGGLLGLLAELVHRRIRSAEDLRLVADVPLLGTVPRTATPKLSAKGRTQRRRQAALQTMPA